MSSFTPFNQHGALRQTWRRLPHWEQPGATYFVTFRLADSLPAEGRGLSELPTVLPAEARARLAEIRDLSQSEQFFWLDDRLDSGAGHCLFSEAPNASMMEAVLRSFDGVRYNLGAFAVMPNHVHALVQPMAEEPLPRLLHRWKSFSARQLQRTRQIAGAIWQDERFDRIVRNDDELRTFTEYILANPSVAQLEIGSYAIGQGSAEWFD